MSEGPPTVLLRRSALGDVILLGAVTGAIEGRVTVVTEAWLHPLVRRFIGVDEVSAWPQIPPGRVVDLQGTAWGRLRAHRRIRKRSLRRRIRLWTGWGPRRPTVPELYAEAVGVRPRPPPWIEVPGGPREVLALIPGAAWAPKRPRADRLVAAGRAWEGPVVVLGGPGEEAAVEAVCRQLPGAEAVVERGFQRTLEVLGATAVAVAGDSGLMHLAGACGARVVALFGPTHPDDGFFVYPGVALGHPMPCRPCALHRVPRCRRGDLACQQIPVEEVVKAVGCVG